MDEELVRNEWGAILRHPAVVELRWLADAAPMTDGAFMATLCLLATEAEKARPRGVLIDAREFFQSIVQSNEFAVFSYRQAAEILEVDPATAVAL